MKKLCITYHMEKPGETAETCITLPMLAETAENIMKTQTPTIEIEAVLELLSGLQGYEYAGTVCVEIAKSPT